MSYRFANPLILLVFLGMTAAGEPVLRLKTRTAAIDNRAPASEYAPLKRLSLVRSHFIVQFAHPPTSEQIRALENRGARVLAPVPDYALLVTAPDGFDGEGLGLLQSASMLAQDKISPLLTDVLEDPDTSLMRMVVEFHADVEPWQAREVVLREGLRLLENPDLLDRQLLVGGTREQMRQLSQWDEVAYVFPASEDLLEGRPVRACAGAVVGQGLVGQYIAKVGDGWDGPGRGAAELTYSLEKLTGQIATETAETEILRALEEWARHAQLSFRRGGHPAAARHLNFLFVRGSHGDPYPFDGPGRVLAHTFFPAPPNPEPIAGDLHFDEDESWQVGADFDLYTVVLHELGHALGLGHSDRPGTVMYPYYRRATTLTDEDVGALLELYAVRDVTQPPPEPPSPKPPAPDPPAPNPPSPKPAKLELVVQQPSGVSARTSSSTITISGVVTGGEGDAVVTWLNSRGGAGSAQGSRNWMVPAVPLSVGSNLITVSASDASKAVVTRSILVERQAEPTPPDTPASGPDHVAPSLRIVSPANANLLTSEQTIRLGGTASDNVGVTEVSWSSNTAGSGLAVGTTEWTTPDIPLLVGINVITVRARDASGNSSWRSVMVTKR